MCSCVCVQAIYFSHLEMHIKYKFTIIYNSQNCFTLEVIAIDKRHNQWPITTFMQTGEKWFSFALINFQISKSYESICVQFKQRML